MYVVAVIDDSESQIQATTTYLTTFAQEEYLSFQVKTFNSAKAFIDQYEQIYDLVLMDIEMPELDGITAAKKLRELDPDVVLIFVTNFARYAINGFEVNAIDFIVKPVEYKSFSFKLKRALKYVRPNQDDQRSIVIKSQQGMKSVLLKNITHIEVLSHDLYYYTTDGVIKLRGTLKSAMNEIDSDSFCLCNKCYLVNLAYVSEIKHSVVVVNKKELVISRPRRQEFMKALARYYERKRR